MAWAVSLTQQTYETEAITTLQYQLTEITNGLMALSRQSAAVYEEQNNAMRNYINQHQADAEGVVDSASFDYVNSVAFTLPFERALKEIQVKEQALEQQKLQTETRIKELQTNLDDVEKMTKKNIESLHGYYR